MVKGADFRTDLSYSRHSHDIQGSRTITIAIKSDLFHGELLRLAAPDEAGASVFARWSHDPDYLRALHTDHARPSSAKDLASRLRSESTDPNVIAFRLRSLEDDFLIGSVALHAIEWNDRTALLAIGIGERGFRGKGYGTDALTLILHYAFTELNLHRVGLNVIANNAPAIRADEKVRFVREDVVREAVQRDDHRHDLLLMGILHTEWKGNKSNRSRTERGQDLELLFQQDVGHPL